MSIQNAARKAGVSENAWSRYEQGELMREDIAYKIAEAFGVDLGQIAPQLAALDPARISPIDLTIRAVGIASAGDGSIIFEENELGETERVGEDIIAYEVDGNSMAPVVLNGQRILLDRKATVRDGDIALVHLKDGRQFCKRYFYDEDAKMIVLQPQNQETARPIVIKESDISQIYKVIGTLF